MRLSKTSGFLLLLSCCGWAGTILPTDYLFDNPDVSSVMCGTNPYAGCDYRPNGTGVGWTFTGSSGITSNGVFGLDTPGDNDAAPNGTQVAFIQYAPLNLLSTAGNISQDIVGLDPSAPYVMSFEAAQRPDTVDANGDYLFGGGLNLVLYWCPLDTNCVQIGFVDFNILPADDLGFAVYSTDPFTPGAAWGSMQFQAADPDTNDRTDFIDDVQFTGGNSPGPTPEPSNGLMALTGIGLIGLALRRRIVRNRSLPS